MQVLRQEKPFRSRELTLAQKVCYLGSFYFYWMSYVKFFFVITPMISLMLGVFVLVTDPASYASYFLPYFVLNLAGSVLLQGGFRNFLLSERFNLLKMHVLMRTLSGLFEKNAIFFVTPKARATAARASEVLLPLTLLALLTLSIAVGAVRIQGVEFLGYFWWALAVNLAWAVIFLTMMAGLVVRSLQHREQRSKYRFHLQNEVPMRLTFADTQGRTVDISQYADNLSRAGVSATLDQRISEGTPVQLEFFFPDYSVQLAGKVVRNQPFIVDGQERIASGIQFDEVSPQTQDEISVFLLQEVAPLQSRLLNLTHDSQAELEIA
jgi:cellulose synthase (UDP-forming)